MDGKFTVYSGNEEKQLNLVLQDLSVNLVHFMGEKWPKDVCLSLLNCSHFFLNSSKFTSLEHHSLGHWCTRHKELCFFLSCFLAVKMFPFVFLGFTPFFS